MTRREVPLWDLCAVKKFKPGSNMNLTENTDDGKTTFRFVDVPEKLLPLLEDIDIVSSSIIICKIWDNVCQTVLPTRPVTLSFQAIVDQIWAGDNGVQQQLMHFAESLTKKNITFKDLDEQLRFFQHDKNKMIDELRTICSFVPDHRSFVDELLKTIQIYYELQDASCIAEQLFKIKSEFQLQGNFSGLEKLVNLVTIVCIN